MPQYGYGPVKRFDIDSSLTIPTTCGVPTLRTTLTKKAAIAFDSCNNKFYKYNPKTLTWSEISGTTIDTTSLSNRIDLRVKYSDTSSMLSPYLRSINQIDTTSLSNRINLKLSISDTSSMLNPYLRKIDTTSMLSHYFNNTNYGLSKSGQTISVDTSKISTLYQTNLRVKYTDTASMLTPYLRKIDTTNKWVNNITRTAGKDSIIYYIGSNRYAIKDSIGTNPAPVGYYGAWQDSTTQSAPSSNVGVAMIFRVKDLENQVRVVTNGTNLSRITFDNTGIYNLQFSSQFQNTNNQLQDVTIWLRKNGVDVPGSSGYISVPNSHGGVDGHIVVSWNYLLSIVGGEYYEIVWSTTLHTAVTMQYYAAGNPPPSTASVIATVTQQSGIMAGTGITAINSLTKSVQRLVTGTSGTDFNISSSDSIHTFNLPTASATNRGALSSANWSTFNGKIGAGDTASMLTNYINSVNYGLSKSSQTVSADTSKLSTLYQTNLKVKYTDTASMLTPYARTTSLSSYLLKTDTATLSNRINLKVNISDTASMLTNYAKTSAVNLKVNISDTASMLTPHFRKIDTASLSSRINLKQDALTFSTGLTNTSGTITSNLSVGVSGGQSVVGGTAASNNLTLSSTSNATKGKILFGTSGYDEANNRLGLGTSSPVIPLDVVRTSAGAMGRATYETAAFSYNSDNKVGIYTSVAHGSGGASLIFGNSGNTTSATYYPGFEYQFNSSATIASNYLTNGFVSRNSTGTVVGAVTGILNLYADGKVVMNGSATGLGNPTVSNKLLINTATDNGQVLQVNGTAKISNTLTTAGNLFAYVNKTSAYTLTATDQVVTADGTSGAFSITLPTSASKSGQTYTIKKIDASANAITVNTTSSQTIDGATTYSLATQYKYVTVISNGSNWFIISNN